MQSSYSVIKENFTEKGEAKKIATKYVKNFSKSHDENMGSTPEEIIVNYEELIKNYESIAGNILKNAREEAERIKIEALEKASILEKEIYQRAHEDGKRNGYEDGMNEALSQYIPDAKRQAEETIVIADSILKYAKAQYEEYLLMKKEEILDLSFTIAHQVLKYEVEERDAYGALIEQVLEDSKGEENIIIKCNPTHEEQISSKINLWRTNYSIKGEIFILPNPSIPEGNAVVEKNSGLMEVGIDVALNIIKEELFS